MVKPTVLKQEMPKLTVNKVNMAITNEKIFYG
jgi:hypothetical protein